MGRGNGSSGRSALLVFNLQNTYHPKYALAGQLMARGVYIDGDSSRYSALYSGAVPQTTRWQFMLKRGTACVPPSNAVAHAGLGRRMY